MYQGVQWSELQASLIIISYDLGLRYHGSISHDAPTYVRDVSMSDLVTSP
jgi:hypothetical protein